MPSPSTNFENDVETIRNSRSTADQKKNAAASIALTLINSQALGNSGYDPSVYFGANGSFSKFVSDIQASITNI